MMTGAVIGRAAPLGGGPNGLPEALAVHVARGSTRGVGRRMPCKPLALFVAASGAALAARGAQAAGAVPGLEVTGLSTMIMSLALVIGFIFAAAFVAKRMPFGLGARGNSGALKVLAALPLGPKERLLLVQARGEELLIAVSPAGVFNVGAPIPGFAPGVGSAAGAIAPRSAEPAPAKFELGDEP